MARIKLMMKPGDYPAATDDDTQQAVTALFGHLFPGVSDPEIPGSAAGFGVVAQDPQLALLLINLSDYITQKMPITRDRRDLRELIIQTLNYHFKCDFSFQSHLRASAAAGIVPELVAAIPYWRTANCFSPEQRLIIEYTLMVVSGDVPDELFARVRDAYGERTAVEITTAIAWWSFWAMIINAARPEFDFGIGKPKA